MRRTVFAICLLIVGMTDVSAQWRAGIYGGAGWTERSLHGVYDYVRSRSMVTGGTLGITGQYNFTDWLGVRTDIVLQQRNFNDTYSILLYRFNHRNTYADVPVMANFSMGGGKLRGYANVGGYAGFWMNHKVESHIGTESGSESGFSLADRRFDAGLAGGIGLSYRLYRNLEADAECMVYYGLTDSHDTGSPTFRQPSYDTSAYISLGVVWSFDRKH